LHGVINICFQQQLLNIIREKRFRKSLSACEAGKQTSPLCFFLINQQNKKQHPNENFGKRSVSRTFTMVVKYTEDEKGQAAFTGWDLICKENL